MSTNGFLLSQDEVRRAVSLTLGDYFDCACESLRSWDFPAADVEGFLEPCPVVPAGHDSVDQESKSIGVKTDLAAYNACFRERQNIRAVFVSLLEEESLDLGYPVPVLRHDQMPILDRCRKCCEGRATEGLGQWLQPDL